MNKEKFVELLNAEKLSPDDMSHLDQLIEQYPWFSLPKFLHLKAAHQNNIDSEVSEISKTVVFSSDRKHLYNWIHEAYNKAGDLPSMSKTEIEFLDVEEASKDEELSYGEPFELLEKEESEMEDSEIDDSTVMPVIDHLKEVDDQEEMENEASSEEPVTQKGLLMKSSNTSSFNKYNKSAELIESFLHTDPGVIKADKETNLEGDVSIDSVQEDDSFITDTLAKIYVKQGLHAKAIYAYERLSLKYPEKSAYFAAQIEKIKIISNV
jgi:hypothetical protein